MRPEKGYCAPENEKYIFDPARAALLPDLQMQRVTVTVPLRAQHWFSATILQVSECVVILTMPAEWISMNLKDDVARLHSFSPRQFDEESVLLRSSGERQATVSIGALMVLVALFDVATAVETSVRRAKRTYLFVLIVVFSIGNDLHRSYSMLSTQVDRVKAVERLQTTLSDVYCKRKK